MNRNLIALISLLAALTALGLLGLRWRAPARQAAKFVASQDRVQEAIGYELGQAVARAFPQGGDVLVLLEGWPAKLPDDARLRGLRAGFGTAKLVPVAVSYKPTTELEGMEMQADWPRRGIPLEKINEWFAGHRGAVAVVSFAMVGSRAGQAVPAEMPPLFLSAPPLLAEGPEAKRLWLDQVRPGALEAVVLRRGTGDPLQDRSAHPLPELFKECCDLLTPATVATARSGVLGE